MTNLRVLILTETFHPEIGGGERQAAVLGRGLASRGHEVIVLTRRSRAGLAPRERIDGLRVVRVGPAGRGRYRKWRLLLSVLPALWQLRGQYDVVLVSGYRILAVPALLAGRMLRKPVVLKADSTGELSGRYFDAGLAAMRLRPDSAFVRAGLRLRNRLLLGAVAFVAISDEIGDETIAHGVAPERVHRIPNGVDTRAFRPATAEERADLKARLELPSGPVVVYTGRLVSYKGLAGLLEAWRRIASAATAATLVLVGEGGGDMHDCEAALREFVQRNRLDGRVRFTGAVTNVEEWLRAADLFVFPTENEAFGLSLVEAMSCGLPAITTATGGIRDFARHGHNAWVIEAGDTAALEMAIRALLDSADQAAHLGRAARETAVARFGESAVADAYERLLSSVLSATVMEHKRGTAA